ncbi:hypothetical protein B0H17DRAFT_1144565 [Mycena rosella]|uniref:Uncharacterized protein n=1 Tax=Mycena rosella TaxID=1033263 RepID=A0AAD7G5K1_MYCRO|nr:hypothetical protein B0H17DRAFT_1144565 [Mycena rosella]
MISSATVLWLFWGRYIFWRRLIPTPLLLSISAGRAQIPAPHSVQNSPVQVATQTGSLDPISQMLSVTLNGPPASGNLSPARSDSTNSTSACPICCQGCGIISGGDEDPNQVRFKPDEIVMMPYPGAPDWRGEDVLWYPARFIARSEASAWNVREFKFRWLECVDWSFHEDSETHLPLLIPRTYQREKQFCEDVADMVLKPKQCTNIFQVGRILGATSNKYFSSPIMNDHNGEISGGDGIKACRAPPGMS